ncbi:AraC family transcriptional regulator, partial [Oscillospiraceae bacterium OttesenSCG-928-F05]|nr:AraC family transcriptional regulator [Oscillospiraceae bacterium OttesenSCG-928-F05]
DLVLEKLSRRLGKDASPRPHAPRNAAFDALVEYISQNYSQKHTLGDLSARFNLSATYICTLFAKHYGATLTIFLTNLRMTKAARMMRESSAAFKEIAAACGYNDYFYFCKVFKNYYGMPPSEYRQCLR